MPSRGVQHGLHHTPHHQHEQQRRDQPDDDVGRELAFGEIPLAILVTLHPQHRGQDTGDDLAEGGFGIGLLLDHRFYLYMQTCHKVSRPNGWLYCHLEAKLRSIIYRWNDTHNI